jgi:predicted DNA-binding helix-hairpin-helix protein
VVGAAEETDREIVLATDRLYKKFALERVYFSAYQDVEQPLELQSPSQPPLFPALPEPREPSTSDIFIREHRLYQVDFLLRKYIFELEDISFDQTGNLDLKTDPKSLWAQNHPDFFPINVNRADYEELLRVPGIGPIGAKRILTARRRGRIHTLTDLSHLGIRTRIAGKYLDLPPQKATLPLFRNIS